METRRGRTWRLEAEAGAGPGSGIGGRRAEAEAEAVAPDYASAAAADFFLVGAKRGRGARTRGLTWCVEAADPYKISRPIELKPLKRRSHP